MEAKVRVTHAGDQRRLPFASLLVACAFIAVGCGRDSDRTILVEADTTGALERSTGNAPGQGLPEVAFLDPESLTAGDSAAGVTSSTRGATPERGPSGGGGSRRTRATGTQADAADARMTEADDPDAGERGDRPPPPVLLSAGRILLPPGTVFAVELRTPIHTATTFVGDRFAARLTREVAAGGRVVIPGGALVEGRVSDVGSASEPSRIAFVELAVRKVVMSDGRRLRITAHLLDVTGQEVLGPNADVQKAGLVTGARDGSEPSEAAREARAAILTGILERLDRPAIVAGSMDREIIIATGTPFTLELVEPLEIPAP